MAGRRLGRDDWADAALDALAEGGLGAVAVEPLAGRLGATKGSFYWHFANRHELIRAALARWAEQHTETVIRELESVTDPVERLDRLFDTVFGGGTDHRVELALLAHADNPAVADLLSAVTARRVDFITAACRQAGYPATEARHRAVLAYTAYIGLIQAQRASGGTLLPDADRHGYLAFLRRTIRR